MKQGCKTLEEILIMASCGVEHGPEVEIEFLLQGGPFLGATFELLPGNWLQKIQSDNIAALRHRNEELTGKVG